MEKDNPKYKRNFGNEFIFSASRSGGPGGQNVNKVNSKVELRFHVPGSAILTDEEKLLIAHKLIHKINQEGYLILTSQTERSQLANKEKVIDRFYALIEKALTPTKKRTSTKPTAASRRKRIDTKKKLSEKKERRKQTELE